MPPQQFPEDNEVGEEVSWQLLEKLSLLTIWRYAPSPQGQVARARLGSGSSSSVTTIKRSPNPTDRE